jgi:hypothetical protein
VRSVTEQLPAPASATGTFGDPPGSLEAVSVVTVSYALPDWIWGRGLGRADASVRAVG